MFAEVGINFWLESPTAHDSLIFAPVLAVETNAADSTLKFHSPIDSCSHGPKISATRTKLISIDHDNGNIDASFAAAHPKHSCTSAPTSRHRISKSNGKNLRFIGQHWQFLLRNHRMFDEFSNKYAYAPLLEHAIDHPLLLY